MALLKLQKNLTERSHIFVTFLVQLKTASQTFLVSNGKRGQIYLYQSQCNCFVGFVSESARVWLPMSPSLSYHKTEVTLILPRKKITCHLNLWRGCVSHHNSRHFSCFLSNWNLWDLKITEREYHWLSFSTDKSKRMQFLFAQFNTLTCKKIKLT